jgi:hypothetical protein
MEKKGKKGAIKAQTEKGTEKGKLEDNSSTKNIISLLILVQIAGKLNNIIKEQHLKDVGQFEQDLVFGDAGTKELINFLRTRLVSVNCNQ